MSFRISARTILQLGAELISSDSVAFYELIKNAFDAGSRRVDIDVYVRMDRGAYLTYISALTNKESESPSAIANYKMGILQDLDMSAPRVNVLVSKIEKADSFEALRLCLEEANYIQIRDRGHGMSADNLQNIYLTIGTPHRQRQRQQASRKAKLSNSTARPILGEKGLGRLSAMRLGSRLSVLTTTKGEKRWNQLLVDWRDFADADALVEDVALAPEQGRVKNDPNRSGTRIRIYALNSDWSPEALETIAREEFSKLTDPFVPQARYPINLRYNTRPISIPRFDKILFDYSHASVEASYLLEGDEPKFVGTVRYNLQNRENTFVLDKTDFLAITGAVYSRYLASLGPFSVRFYWYNRRILTAIEGIGDQKAVRDLVAAWSGGLKVYRDGFRVNPYGSPDDDWLDLDEKALASGGYKVNRRQIVGVVAISSLANPELVDQTNREGLRDCPQKQVLAELLRHLMEVQFRQFLNAVDEEIKAQIPVSFEDFEERVENEERQIQRSLQVLLQKYPEIKSDRRLIRPINASIRQIRSLMDEASRLAESYREGHTELTNLAGIGLMVEIVAHELNRATAHTLRLIADADLPHDDAELGALLQTLGAQMQTLQKRLSILDPLSTAGRQRKERFDLVSWVDYIVDSHRIQFARHNVKLEFQVVPSSSSEMRVYMVKGMFVQILENLLANSMYWLKVERRLKPSFVPRIEIIINRDDKTLSLTDNGPGIPLDRQTQVFQPFFTTKPPGEGHGLGLYVSKEIAKYNGAALSLSEVQSVHSVRLNTFILQLESGTS